MKFATYIDLILMALSTFLLWDVLGLSRGMAKTASRIAHRKVETVTILGDSATAALLLCIITAMAEGNLTILSFTTCVTLSAIIKTIHIWRK